ncbi:MAG: right-handed parallel beta-helix repeat-containing protein [Pseudomonadota bacterium]
MTLRLSLLLLAAALTAACSTPHRKHKTPEELACAAGYLADGDVCVPEACGVGTWGALEVDGGTVYVSASAEEGGDGSAEAPLRSVQAGLDLAGERGGGLVAVAAGTYPETLALTSDHAGVHLAGRCRELVVVDASVGDEETPGIDIDSRYGEVEVSGVGVVGSNYDAVRVGSGVVRLTELRVEGSAYVGVGAFRGTAAAPSDLVLEGCELAGNTAAGVVAFDPGTEVTLVDTRILDTLPNGDGEYGFGIAVLGGASLRAEGCELTGNTTAGVLAIDGSTEVALLETSIRNTLPNGDGEYGFGLQVSAGASLRAEGCELAGNTAMGLVACDPGSGVVLVDASIRDTRPKADGGGGFGIQVSAGASLRAEGSELESNSALGVLALDPDTEVTLVDTAIRDTHPDGDGKHGFGIEVQGGASLRAEGCELAGNTRLGVGAVAPGTEVTLVDTAIRGTLPDRDGKYGFGINVLGGASVRAEGCELAGNRALGVVAADPGTEVALVDTMVRDTLPDGAGEGGYGIEVYGGAALSAEGCAIAGNTSVGIAAMDPGTQVAVRDSSITGTVTGFDLLGATAIGLSALLEASVSASGLLVLGNDGPGLYAAGEGTALICSGCALLDNAFAGAVAINAGALEIRSSTISGTREGVDLGGGVGVFAAQQWDWEPPSLLVADSTLSDNLAAGVWLAGEGSYQLTGNRISGSAALPFGSRTRCGDGVYARSTAAWDGGEGLLLSDNALMENHGAGLFLDDGYAMLSRDSWSGNAPDLWVQGDACLTPREDWAEAPNAEICPEWDRPTCDLAFALSLDIADVDPALPPPPAWLPMASRSPHLPALPTPARPPIRAAFSPLIPPLVVERNVPEPSPPPGSGRPSLAPGSRTTEAPTP